MIEIRLLPFLVADGPTQMARDEALHESAARGGSSMRFYRWSEPTLSLGYFQRADERLADPKLAALPWVRRASGGAAILHHAPYELTYSLALPADAAKIPAGDSWICRVHHALRDGLRARGLGVRAVVCGEEQKLGDFLCFLHHTPGDLVLAGAKVVGSAQRKQHGALLQHGTILLAQSPLTPLLPGIRERGGMDLTEVEIETLMRSELGRQFGWTFAEGDWTAGELAAAERIEGEKYRSREWNERR